MDGQTDTTDMQPAKQVPKNELCKIIYTQ